MDYLVHPSEQNPPERENGVEAEQVYSFLVILK
jgi:hypothetical protein